MVIKLNVEGVQQLEALMVRTAYTNHTHCHQHNDIQRHEQPA